MRRTARNICPECDAGDPTSIINECNCQEKASMDSKGKWTPGPWNVEEWPAREGDEYQRPRLVVVADGGYLCELEIPADKEARQEVFANGTLLAAAPLMVEALDEASRYLKARYGETMEVIEAALRKARGES